MSNATAAAATTRTIRVATEHATVDEFIPAFCRFCDRTSFFLSTSQPAPPIGTEIEFQVSLRTGERMLRGIGSINAAWPTAESPWGAAGVHIGIKKMTSASSEMFAKLRAARGNTTSMTLLGIPVVEKPPAGADAIPLPLPPRVRTNTGPIPLPIPVTPANQTKPLRRVSTIAPWEPRPTGRIPTIPEIVPVVPAVSRTRTKVDGATPPPALTRARRPSMEPIIGDRTPGSPHVLPANPLSELSDTGIHAFVENATFLTEGSEGAPVASPPRAPTPPPIPQPPPELVARAPSEPHLPRPTSTASEPVVWRNSRKIIAAAAVLATLVIVGIVFALDNPTPSPSPSPSSDPSIAPPPPTIALPPPPTASPPPPTVVTAQVPPPPPPPPSEPCTIDVDTSPAGAAVFIDGKAAGRTPITIPSPCTRRRVTVSRSGYDGGVRWVSPTAARPTAKVDVVLRRPRHALTISTKPGGATVFVDGKRAGVSPTTIKVAGFVPSTIKIIKPGHEIVTRKIVSRKKSDKLSVFLRRE